MNLPHKLIIYYADPRIDRDDKVEAMLWEPGNSKRTKDQFKLACASFVHEAYVQMFTHQSYEQYEQSALYREFIREMKAVYRQGIQTYGDYTITEARALDRLCAKLDEFASDEILA